MKHKYLKNVTTLNLIPGKCTGCGKCTEVCPHGVFSIGTPTDLNVVKGGSPLVEKRAVIIDKNSCMECGACAKNCPMSAIAVDANTGCATAIIFGWLTGKEPTCGCDSAAGCC